MRKISKVGVVGCGYWGPNLIRNLQQSADCQLKVICDTSEQRLRHMRRLHPEVATTNNFEELLNDAELDALVIATPVRLHFEMAKACLESGKHAFVEKPMARTEAEGEELVALVVLSVHANTAIDAQVAATTANRTTGTLRFTRHLRRASPSFRVLGTRIVREWYRRLPEKACHPTHH